MFSPEEYLGFEPFRDFFSDWSYRIYLAHLVEQEGGDVAHVFESTKDAHQLLLSHRIRQFQRENKKERIDRDEPHWDNHVGRTREDDFQCALIFHVMFSNAIMGSNTLLASPDGKIIRPDNYVFIHLDRLDWTHLSWPVREVGAFIRLFELFDSGGFNGADLAERYCFLDFGLGTLRKKNNSISGFKLSSHFDDEDFCERYISTHVDPFLSWALVWSADDLQTFSPQFFENHGFLEQHWHVPTLLKKRESENRIPSRRGAKPTGAKSEFLRRYPLGKPDDLSADAVAAELKEAGFPISGRQVLNYSKEIKGE